MCRNAQTILSLIIQLSPAEVLKSQLQFSVWCLYEPDLTASRDQHTEKATLSKGIDLSVPYLVKGECKMFFHFSIPFITCRNHLVLYLSRDQISARLAQHSHLWSSVHLPPQSSTRYCYRPHSPSPKELHSSRLILLNIPEKQFPHSFSCELFSRAARWSWSKYRNRNSNVDLG